MCIRKYCITLILLLLGVGVAQSQERRTEIKVHFRVGDSILNSEFADNGQSINRMISFLDSLRNDTTVQIKSVTFRGSASPEGSSALNKRLASLRLASLEGLVRSRINLPDSIVHYEQDYIAWESLVNMLNASDLKHRQEAMHIIQETPIWIVKNGRVMDGRVKQLMEVNYGRTWHEMVRRFFPEMRNACAMVVTFKQKAEKVIPIVELPVIVPVEVKDTVIIPVQEPIQSEPEKKSEFRIAVKTNMLYDILAIPNLGAEIPLGDSWSIAGNWMYAWWKNDNKNWYHRVYGGDLGLRYWLGNRENKSALCGHHLGVYGQMLSYDFCFDGDKGELADRWSYATGIEYGYSFPITKCLNIDFSIGVGYLTGKYKTYIPQDDCYVWQSTHNRHFFGPTKIEASLVWLLGRSHYNKEKGGGR